jgi:hypothetical protein
VLIIITAFVSVVPNVALQHASGQHDHEASFHATETVADFHVELTIDPGTIEPGVLTKFGMIFRDTVTGKPALEVPHTFLLIIDDQVIFRESITSANYLHEFTFTEEQKGPLTVVIENVNNSGENARFSLMVVPEFPFSALLVMTGVTSMMLVIMRLKCLHFASVVI